MICPACEKVKIAKEKERKNNGLSAKEMSMMAYLYSRANAQQQVHLFLKFSKTETFQAILVNTKNKFKGD